MRIKITLEISNKQSVITIGKYPQIRLHSFVVQLCVATSCTMSFNSIDIYRVRKPIYRARW